MLYAGCDQHKHYTYVVVKNQDGFTMDQAKLYHHEKEYMKQYFGQLPEKTSVLLEASGFNPWLCDLLQELEVDVKLAHPFKTRAIAEEKIKTDKLSATVLADLLRTGFISEAYCASPKIRQQRYQMRYRQTLVHLRTMAKNRIHALLDRLGITPPSVTDLFGKQGRVYLEQLRLSKVYREALNGYLTLLDTFTDLIKQTEVTLHQQFRADQNVKLLMTMPGIGFILAAFITAEIGSFKRFLSCHKLASYIGIIPSLHQSGKMHHSGAITKRGNKYLRWAFIEAAHVAIRKDLSLGSRYQKIKTKKGHQVAIVAVARKMVTYAYYILLKQVPYKSQQLG